MAVSAGGTMRQKRTRRFLVVFAAAFLGLALPGLLAAESEAVTVKVQGVLATGGGKATATVAPSLKAYAEVLKRFAFSNYQDIGAGSGVVRTDQKTAIKVGSHTIEATLVQVDRGTARINYTIKDSKGASIGSNAMALAPGQIMPIQIGDPAFPIILFFQASR